MDIWLVYTKGLATMAGLIFAIGAQNAFVLRQGLKRRGVFLTASICFLCDTTLVILGAAGLGALFSNNPLLSLLMAFGGAAFLTYYGFRALHAAKKAKGLDLRISDKVSHTSIALTALAVSLLNPPAYIDTLVLVGGLAGRYEGVKRIACASGAITVSFVWFYSIAYGARWLAPALTKPRVWRIIDLVIGVMMLALAVGLVADGIRFLQN